MVRVLELRGNKLAMHRFCCLPLSVILATAVANGLVVAADDSLHSQVDALVAAKFAGQQPVDAANDMAFQRRIWLDLAGRIPSTDEARRFLKDGSANKRTAEIDRLLAASTYAERMEDLFHVMLMERRGDDDNWRKFLRQQFEKNQPWDGLARAILMPNDEDELARGAAYFYTKRLAKYGQNPTDFPGLTRDVGRLFLGVDLQCAECHDHLFIDDYKQRDFQGLFAVFKNLSIRRGVDFPAVNEKAMTAKLEFVSVFAEGKDETGPRIPFADEFPIPPPPAVAPEKKKTKPDPNAKPAFSALSLIAEQIAAHDRELFNRNIVNRLWFLMMGRGLVEPLDQFHSGNPPSHPELLDLLAREFAAHKYDIKWFLRELAMSQTYQRDSRLLAGAKPPAADTYLTGNERRLSAEQLLSSTLIATGNFERLSKSDGDKPNEQFAEVEKKFLTMFANEPREPEVDFSATVKGALFLLNDDKFLNLLKPEPGNLVHRLLPMTDSHALTEELFLSVFTRPPTDDERAAVADYLKQNSARRETALSHVVWSMLASMEFYVNH